MTTTGPTTKHPKRILYVANALLACAWYRCHVPGIELLRRGHDVELRDVPGQMNGLDPEILVLQSAVTPNMLAAVDYINRIGGLTIYDMDDDPWVLHPENPGHQYWSSDLTQTNLADALRSVKLITTTTPELAERFARFNKNVVVLPNMLPQDFWPEAYIPKPISDPIVVGWAGGNAHAPDIREVVDVFYQILDRYPNVEVHLPGARPEWLPRNHPRIKFPDTVTIDRYYEVINGFDIALAPLADNRFNDAKSDLKVLEYGMAGIPSVASKSPAYRRSIKHGETGFLATSHKDWLQHIRKLIEDVPLRQQMGENARAWAETRTIERNIGLWQKAYGIKD